MNRIHQSQLSVQGGKTGEDSPFLGIHGRQKGSRFTHAHYPYSGGSFVQGNAQSTLEGLVIAGKYELVKRIGAGGMGEVYRSRQLSTGGRVAVKVMSTLKRSEKTIERFRYEAETTAQLTHPNTVRILDFGSDQDLFYLVMEYLSGTDLTRFLRPDGQSDAFVSHVLFQVACSLTEAHSRGVVHRDIKPNNIKLLHHVGHPSFAKVIDFGIARAIGGPGLGTMGILGTIGYIAPEQADGEVKPDARTDLYALGCVAYELLTGRLPFDGITHQSAPLDILEAHRIGQARHVLAVQPNADEELANLIMTLLSRDPAHRPTAAGDLVVPLHGIRSRRSSGIAYAIDVPRPTDVQSDAFEGENVIKNDIMTDPHLLGHTVADARLSDLIFAEKSERQVTASEHPNAIGIAPTIALEETSAAPPAGTIPPPLHGELEPPAPEVEDGESDPRADADSWSFGATDRPLEREQTSANAHTAMVPTIILGCAILGGLLWFLLRN